MTMDISKLYEILDEATILLRKGEEIEREKNGAVEVVSVFAMPHEREAKPELVKVDCCMVVVGVDKTKIEAKRNEFIALMDAWPNADELASGPSYIAVGATIGDQGAAFRMFAAGEVLGLWKVITPATLGVSGPQAMDLAGAGYIMCSGYSARAAS